jgi:hypothetical protein
MGADEDASLPEMVGQLAADSKRLVSDEVRLAHLEIEEGARGASRGLAAVAAAFGIAVIATSAATLLIAMLVGDLTGRLWLGALLVGAIEVMVGGVLYRRGRLTLSGSGDRT